MEQTLGSWFNVSMLSASREQERDRAIACFKALAIGDALAKQTETLRFSDVRAWYPDGIRGFEGTPGDVIPRYRGKRYEWKVGETTDDTEQSLAVARALSKINPITHAAVGQELLTCIKSVHPGVSMWAFVQAGDPARIAAEGDGCGAAMRVSAIGVLHRSLHIDKIVRDAYQCSLPTHGGQSAICAAAAVAAAISASLDRCPPAEVLGSALQAATMAEALRTPTRPCTIAASLVAIHAELSRRVPVTPEYIAQHYFPVTPETIVPVAISLALVTQSVEETVLIAANVGGDADSVASIGGAIAGALRPDTVNSDWFDVVTAVNTDDVVAAALSVAALRQ